MLRPVGPQTFFLALIGLLVAFSTGTVVHLTGKLRCRGKGLPNAQIELMERDLFDPDDFLARVNTSNKGHFDIKGEHDEWFGSIEPYLLVKHNCSAEEKKKVRKRCVYTHKLTIEEEEKDDVIESTDLKFDMDNLGKEPEIEECSDEVIPEEEEKPAPKTQRAVRVDEGGDEGAAGGGNETTTKTTKSSENTTASNTSNGEEVSSKASVENVEPSSISPTAAISTNGFETSGGGGGGSGGTTTAEETTKLPNVTASGDQQYGGGRSAAVAAQGSAPAAQPTY